jgi:hypothetical protein
MVHPGFGSASRKEGKPEPEKVNQVQKSIYHAMRVQKPQHGPGDRHYLMDKMMF